MKTKRFTALLMVLVMACALALPAMASSNDDTTPIRIDALSITSVTRGGVYSFKLSAGATYDNVVWTIADPSLGYVDSTGNVTIFDKTGNVRLTAAAPNGTSHSITLRISDAPLPPTFTVTYQNFQGSQHTGTGKPVVAVDAILKLPTDFSNNSVWALGRFEQPSGEWEELVGGSWVPLNVSANGTIVVSRNMTIRPVCFNTDEKAVSLVSIDRTMESIKILSKDIGIRLVGMPNEEKAVDWLLDEFEMLGLETEKHQFTLSTTTQNNGYITIHNREQYFGLGTFDNGTGGPFMPWHEIWETGAAANGRITGPDAKVTAEVVFVGDVGSTPTQEQFDAANVQGKIALIGISATATMATMAANSGAVGLLGFTTALGGRGNHSSAANPGVTAGTAGATIPVMGLARCHGEWLLAMIRDTATDPVTIDISTQRFSTPVSWNAIGVKPAKNNPESAPIFFITGHIDSVKGAPGANDNASGVAVTLEAARALTKVNTDDAEIRFIGFGAEEVGLVGSARYVARMSAAERARVKGVFNMDMTGSKDEVRTWIWAMATVDGRPNLVTDTFIATGERLGYGGVLELMQFSSSDHVSFHNGTFNVGNGTERMPAAMGMWFGRPAGYTGQLNPSNYMIEACYHTPLDTMEDNVGVERMRMCIEVVTAAVYDMALNTAIAPAPMLAAAPSFRPVIGTAFEDPYMYILTGAYQDELQAEAAEAEAAAETFELDLVG